MTAKTTAEVAYDTAEVAYREAFAAHQIVSDDHLAGKASDADFYASRDDFDAALAAVEAAQALVCEEASAALVAHAESFLSGFPGREVSAEVLHAAVEEFAATIGVFAGDLFDHVEELGPANLIAEVESHWETLYN